MDNDESSLVGLLLDLKNGHCISSNLPPDGLGWFFVHKLVMRRREWGCGNIGDREGGKLVGVHDSEKLITTAKWPWGTGPEVTAVSPADWAWQEVVVI
jgi:hypothetical protein